MEFEVGRLRSSCGDANLPVHIRGSRPLPQFLEFPIRGYPVKFWLKESPSVGLLIGNMLAQHIKVVRRENIKFAENRAVMALGDVVDGLQFAVTAKPEWYLVEREYPDTYKHTRRIARHCRTTLILMCEIAGADEFYRRLNVRCGLPIQPIPHYITMYTTSDNHSRGGVGLADMQQFEKWTTRIEPSPDTAMLYDLLK